MPRTMILVAPAADIAAAGRSTRGNAATVSQDNARGGGGSEARGPILHPFASSTLPGSDLEEFPRLHPRWVPEEDRGIAWRALRGVLIEGIK